MINKLKEYPRHGAVDPRALARQLNTTVEELSKTSAADKKRIAAISKKPVQKKPEISEEERKRIERQKELDALPSRQIPNAVENNAAKKYLDQGLERKSNNMLDRDKAGNLKFVQNEEQRQPLLIEPIVETYTNKSFIETVDTQFQYFKFPPRIKGEGNLDIDFDIDINIDDSGFDPVSGFYMCSSAIDAEDAKLRHLMSTQVKFDKTVDGAQIDNDRYQYVITPGRLKYLKESGKTILMEVDVPTSIKNYNQNMRFYCHLQRSMKTSWRRWVGFDLEGNRAKNYNIGFGRSYDWGYGKYVRQLNPTYKPAGYRYPNKTMFNDPDNWGYIAYGTPSVGKAPGVEKMSSRYISGDEDIDRDYYGYYMKCAFKFLFDPNDIKLYDMYHINIYAVQTGGSGFTSGGGRAKGDHIGSYDRRHCSWKILAIDDPVKKYPGRTYYFTGKKPHPLEPNPYNGLSDYYSGSYPSSVRTTNPYGMIYDSNRSWWLNYRPQYD